MLTCACVALVGCEAPEEVATAPPAWVYPPSIAAWPVGASRGTIGRSQPPQLVDQVGITGKTLAPLRLPTPWTVPGAGPARAAVYGLAGDTAAVELIDVDAGTILWRDTETCAAPIVGVTETAIVCADARGTRAVKLDGTRAWTSEAAFVAMTGEHVVLAGAGEAVIVEAERGEELARVKLPAPVVPRGQVAVPVSVESVIASCGDAGRELFAYGQSGELVRIAEGPGGPKIMWATPLPTVVGIDACEGATILVTAADAAGTILVALARDTGQQLGAITGVRGFWPARDGSPRLEVSTSDGVRIYERDLAGVGEPTALPVLGELLATRGDMRLVRATKHTAAVLDRRGVRAYLPLAGLGAVLGDGALVAASWLGSPGETVHRFALPARYHRVLRVPPPPRPVAVPAELRDLPVRADLDVSGAIAHADAGTHELGPIALDAREPVVYATTLAPAPDASASVGIARLDLAGRAWAWHRADGCGVGTPVGLAVARELVVCASRSSEGAAVHALGHDGTSRWQWRGDNVDAVQAAADIVVVHDAALLHVLDGSSGARLATYASDDGAPMRVAALDIDGMALVVMFQRNLVLARLPRVRMVPAWTLRVAGVVRSLAPAGDGVLVELEDGDAYRVDGRTGAAVAMPGLDLVWGASGDVVTGQGPGGPIPPEAMPAPETPQAPTRKVPVRRRRPPPRRNPGEDPPRLPTPWPALPALETSWQYTLFELSGALRARNDYALAAPITPAPRGPGDSPVVIQFGPGLRELLVVDPRRGDPLRRIHLPEDAAPGTAFATVVDGNPVVGTLLANPLRAVLF